MTYFQKLYKAITLDVAFYEMVESDKSLTNQALMTVILVSIVQGIIIGSLNPIILAQGALGSVVRWIIWSMFIVFVGTKILPEPTTSSNTGELLRVLGFASAPSLLYALKIFPFIGGLVELAVPFLQIAAFTVAVRQALDFQSTVRAVGVSIVAMILMMISLMLFIGFTWFFIGIAENAVSTTNPLIGA